MSGIAINDAIVRRLAERGHVFARRDAAAVETDHGPAHAQAAAVMLLGRPVRFDGLNQFGHAIYRIR